MTPSRTPLQSATVLAIGTYTAALRLLVTAAERTALRDAIAARLANDYLEELEHAERERNDRRRRRRGA